jgi:hypothetical protein
VGEKKDRALSLYDKTEEHFQKYRDDETAMTVEQARP